MSDPVPSHDDHYEPHHEGPIRTPKQLLIAVVAAFAIPIAIIIMLASYVSGDRKPGAGTELLADKAVAGRIAPVGTVAVKDPGDTSALKTGTQVYAAQCAACHDAALAGAPKFGDAAAWAPRIEQGYETLLASVLKGKGAMPPQGGGDFGELELGRAVVHMANAGGAKFEEPKPGAEAATAASAPALAAPVSTTSPAPAQAPVPAAAEAPAAVGTEAPATAAAGGGDVPPLYTQVCAACHVVGLANAPKLGDKAAWAPRLAAGIDGLTASVIKGKGVMPPKGGAADASEADLRAAVEYMVGTVK